MDKKKSARLVILTLAGAMFFTAAMQVVQAEELTINGKSDYDSKKSTESAWFHQAERPSYPDTGLRLYHTTSMSNNMISISGDSGDNIQEGYIRIYGGYAQSEAASSNQVILKNMSLSGYIYGGYVVDQSAASNSNQITLDSVAFEGQIIGGSGEESKDNTITIKNDSDVSKAKIIGSNASTTSVQSRNNSLNFENWGGKVGSISNIDKLNIKDLKVNNDGGLVIQNGGSLKNTDITFSGSITLEEGIEKSEGDHLNLVSGATGITTSKVNTSGVSVNAIKKDLGSGQGVRVTEFGTIENSDTAIYTTVTKSILAGSYEDTSNKTGDGTLTLDSSSTKASRIAGAYDVSASTGATSGNLTITDGAFGTAQKGVWLYGGYSQNGAATSNELTISGGTINGTIYGGYSEKGEATSNTTTLSAGAINGAVYGGYSTSGTANNNTVVVSGVANVSNADLFGSNKKDSTGNTLNLSGWKGNIKSVNNFQTVQLGSIEVSNDPHITISGASDFTGANVTVGDLTLADNLDLNKGTYQIFGGEKVTGLDKVANAGEFSSKKPADKIEEGQEGGGVRVHRFDGLQLTANTISLKVKDSILAGKYTDGSATKGTGTLTIGKDFTTNADIVAGAFGSGSQNAEGGNITIGANYNQSYSGTIYAGYSEAGSVNNNTITIEKGAATDLSGIILKGKNEVTGTGNTLVLNGWGGTLGNVSGFDTIAIHDLIVGNDGGLVIVGKDSDLSTITSLTGSIRLSEDLDKAKGDILDIIKGASDRTLLEAGKTFASGLNANVVQTEQGVRIHTFGDVTTTANSVSIKVDKSILAGKYSNGSVVGNGNLTIDDGFSTKAEIVAGAYGVGSQEATGGHVVISGTSTIDNVYGGYSESGTTSGNTITVKGNVDMSNTVLWGSNVSGGTNNKLIFDGWGGKVGGIKNFNAIEVHDLTIGNDGGIDLTAYKDDLMHTTVELTGKVQFADNLDKANGETITIVKGMDTNEFSTELLPKEWIVETENGVRVHTFEDIIKQANEVTVKVSGSTLSGAYVTADRTYGNGMLTIGKDFTSNANIIAGAYGEGNQNVSGGKVMISGIYAGTVYGGYSENGTTGGNTITLHKEAIVENAHLVGGFSGKNALAVSAKEKENTLVLDGWKGTVGNISDFDTIVMTNQEWENGGTILTIQEGDAGSLSETTLNLEQFSFANGNTIQKGESMTFIKSGNGVDLGLTKENIKDNGFTAGIATVGEGEFIVNDNGEIEYKITEVRANDQVRLALDGQALGTALVNQGADLAVATMGAKLGHRELGTDTFGAVSGNFSTYNVNEELKLNGWSMVAGVGRTTNAGQGTLTYGAFYENGTGNYRTVNMFENTPLRGDGSLSYDGFGLGVQYEKENGWYTEAGLRMGTMKNSMTNAFRDGVGQTYGFHSESDYYGAHIGFGKITKLSETKERNIYGQYFHTHVDGDRVTVANDVLDINTVSSDRVRLGIRWTEKKSPSWNWYGGVAYEYEFSGDTAMTANRLAVTGASLEGSTYIAELGMTYRTSEASPWEMKLNLQGYAGDRKGGSASVQVGYHF